MIVAAGSRVCGISGIGGQTLAPLHRFFSASGTGPALPFSHRSTCRFAAELDFYDVYLSKAC